MYLFFSLDYYDLVSIPLRRGYHVHSCTLLLGRLHYMCADIPLNKEVLFYKT